MLKLVHELGSSRFCFSCLCFPQFSGPSLRNMEEVFEDLSTSYIPVGCTEELLGSLEDKVELEVKRYLQNLWEEVEPEVADRLRAVDEEVLNKEDRLRSYNEEIEEERSKQESLLKGLRVSQQQPQQPPPVVGVGGRLGRGGSLSLASLKAGLRDGTSSDHVLSGALAGGISNR